MPNAVHIPGRRPAERRVLHPKFIDALAASPYPLYRIREWLKSAKSGNFSAMNRGEAFPGTAKTLTYLREIAERIGYHGQISTRADSPVEKHRRRKRELLAFLKGGAK